MARKKDTEPPKWHSFDQDPDDSIGNDDDWAYSVGTAEVYEKLDGAWVSKGTLKRQADVTTDLGFMPEVLVGNVRDFLLDHLRHAVDPRPWNERSEDQQRLAVDQATTAAESVVRSVVNLVASAGCGTISAKVKAVKNDGDKVDVTLIVSNLAEGRHELFDAAGEFVKVVIADPKPYMGEGDKPEITPDPPEKPDQPDLLDGEKEGATGEAMTEAGDGEPLQGEDAGGDPRPEFMQGDGNNGDGDA